jgi:hypothetical protein
MRKARRGVILTGGGNARAIAKGIAYDRKRRAEQLHGGTAPRMGANDLWDVSCWCGWSSTCHERRELAVDAATLHRQEAARGTVTSDKKKRRAVRRIPATVRSSKQPKAEREPKSPTSEPASTLGRDSGGGRSRLTYRGRTVELVRTGDTWAAHCPGCKWSDEGATSDEVRIAAVSHLRVCTHQVKQRRKR